ncbi:MAG: flavodoxin domain-containing protein [Woeseiaceae bacterium]
MATRTLVLFATREGQTQKVATRIADHLAEGGANVNVVNAADLGKTGEIDLDQYDLLIFGASMHAGGIEKELVDFISQNQAQIETKTRSFFLVLLSAATVDPDLRRNWLADALEKVTRQLNVSFDKVEMIAGALMYSKYSLPMKWLMKSIAGKVGEDTDTSEDYEYTDWEQVRRYAQELIRP